LSQNIGTGTWNVGTLSYTGAFALAASELERYVYRWDRTLWDSMVREEFCHHAMIYVQGSYNIRKRRQSNTRGSICQRFWQESNESNDRIPVNITKINV